MLRKSFSFCRSNRGHGSGRGIGASRRVVPSVPNLQNILRHGPSTEQNKEKVDSQRSSEATKSEPMQTFSFRIGSKFEGFTPQSNHSDTPNPSSAPTSSSHIRPPKGSRGFEPSDIAEEEIELENPDESYESPAKNTKRHPFYADGDSAIDREINNSFDDEGHDHNQPQHQRRTPEEKRAAVRRVRALQLQHQISKRMPAVRDWHALAAARKKTLVVPLDSEVEVQLDEIAPYLSPQPPQKYKTAATGLSTQTKVLSSRDLWMCTKLLRTSKAARESMKSVVTGGRNAIRRIWLQYGIVPNVIYVPDDEEIPAWCLGESVIEKAPTTTTTTRPLRRTPIIVRAPGAAINRNLLSAELNDGFAAEFTLDQTSPLFRFDTSAFSNTASESTTTTTRQHVSSAEEHSSAGLDPALLYEDPKVSGLNLRGAVFLTQSMVPSNVGLTVRTAVESGYDAIILDRCADVLNEKVIRASEGTVLNPKAKIFQLNPSHGIASAMEAADVIQKACIRHNLLPLATVPSQDATPAFEMAQKLFYESVKYEERQSSTLKAQANGDHLQNLDDLRLVANTNDGEEVSRQLPPPKGAMVMLGSEAMGLHQIVDVWEDCEFGPQVPYSAVTLQMTDSRVSSINVAVAGGILMNIFRPKAKDEHQQLFRLGVVPEGAENVGMLPRQPTEEATEEGRDSHQ